MKKGKIKVTFLPENRKILIGKGISALEVIELAGLAVDSLCGGKQKCGKCKVRVLDGVRPPTDIEMEKLSQEEVDQGFRLACALRLEGDARIFLPAGSGHEGMAILQEGKQFFEYQIDNNIIKVQVDVDQPSLEDQSSDQERFEKALKQRGWMSQPLNVHLMRELPEKLRSWKYSPIVVLMDGKVISLGDRGTIADSYGLAVDIGTTTVVGYLISLNSGRQVAVASRVNPQRAYGSDVISRAAAVIEKPDVLRKLQASVRDVINEIIGQLISESGIEREHIYKMAVVGNTCMQHLFLGITPKYLAWAPYAPVFTQALEIQARELGIDINPNGQIETLPCFAGFVGADTMGVILSTLLHQSERIKLAIDLGTNGEIVLGSKNGLLCCSAAAGPAFEGEHIECGMVAAPGAIDRVVIHDEVYIHTIGGAPARGICGSGLVDAIAELLKAGIIDERGRMTNSKGTGPLIQKRFRSDKEGKRFFLTYGDRTKNIPPVVITQHDVEELQLAKAAISAGVQILMEEMGITPNDISEVLIAGAFGHYIRKESFCALGILPGIDLNRIKAIGNAAGEGAKIALLSSRYRDETKEIAKKVRYVELSAHPAFRSKFVRSMFFPRPFL